MLRVLLIVLAVLAVLVLLVIALVVVSLKRVVRDLQVGLDDLRRETIPLLDETRSALSRAGTDERKTEALLDAATSLTGTADAATRFAYRMVTNPFVKVLAFFTGTKRAVSALGDRTAPGGRIDRQLRAREAVVARRKAIRVESAEATSRTSGPRVGGGGEGE